MPLPNIWNMIALGELTVVWKGQLAATYLVSPPDGERKHIVISGKKPDHSQEVRLFLSCGAE